MKVRSTEPIIPFMSMKVDNFYELQDMLQGNLSENSQPSNILFIQGKTGNLNQQMINPVQDDYLLPSTKNLRSGNIMEFTLPGTEIRKSHFETIVGPGVMNQQNAYNSY